jgi:hypothetical protein
VFAGSGPLALLGLAFVGLVGREAGSSQTAARVMPC